MKRIALPIKEGYEFIPIAELVYIQSSGNYAIAHILDRQPVHVFQSLKDLEESLHDIGFLRIHSSFLINTTHLVKYNKGDGGTVEMSTGKKLEVSRGRKKAFLGRVKYQ